MGTPPPYRLNRAVYARYPCSTPPVLAPTSRLLELLELLQTRPLTTGREIADRLEIDRRTVRRYIATLQELGIPVEGERGVGGGYRLRPGYRLPPLMLNDDEAIVVVLGLIARPAPGPTARPTRSTARWRRSTASSRRALRRRVEALETTLGFTAGDPGRTGRRRGGAAACGRDPSPPARAGRLPVVRGGGDGARAQSARPRRPRRTLVSRRSRSPARRPAHVPGRPDVAPRARRRRGAPPPEGFDAVAHVTRSLARVPWTWEVEVLLDLPVDEAARRIPATLAELVDDTAARCCGCAPARSTGGTRARRPDCRFTIRRPDELRASVRALAKRLAAQV